MPCLILLLPVCLLLSSPGVMADDRPSRPVDPTVLTLDRLFSAKEFDADPVPELRWSKRSSAYFTLEPRASEPRASEPRASEPRASEPRASEPRASGQERDLVRTDPAGGMSQVVVRASEFVPSGSKDGLSVEAFEFSDDEGRLLLYTNSKKVWRRNTRGDYWIFDMATRRLSKLGGDALPATMMFAKFSPDGSKVAYVRDNDLYVQDVGDLRVQRLTTDGSRTIINGTADWVNEEELNLRDCFRWSPDGSHLLFWQFDTSGVPEFHLINNTDSDSPRVFSFAYPKVGQRNSATRLGIVSVGGGAVRWIDLPGDPREHYLAHAEWTPNGAQIVVQQFNRLQTENRVWLVDPQSGVSRQALIESDSAWLENENPVRWLDAGQSLLWLSERSGWRHVYRASVKDASRMPITRGDWDVMEVEALDSQGGWLYYSASPDNATQRYLYRVKLEGGRPQRLSPNHQPGWHQYTISPDARWALQTYSNFSTPPVVQLIRLEDHQVVRTFADNQRLRDALSRLKRPGIEFFQVDVGDGVVLDGWRLQPPGGAVSSPDASRRLPLVIHVYGEPHGQTVRDAWAGPRGLWHWMLAQQGFVVASVDNRGTNVPKGRPWRKSVHRQIGILASKEQAAAVTSLLGRWPGVDPSRVGVWGWSGGGSMSLNAIFRYPDLYQTAIAVAPVADQRLYDTIYQERYMGLPMDNVDGYRDGSPLTHAANLRGNLLLIHGTGDDNCHYQGTERLMDELIARGKPFSVLPYPNRSHSVNEGANTVRHFWETITRFLQANLQPDAATP